MAIVNRVLQSTFRRGMHSPLTCKNNGFFCRQFSTPLNPNGSKPLTEKLHECPSWSNPKSEYESFQKHGCLAKHELVKLRGEMKYLRSWSYEVNKAFQSVNQEVNEIRAEVNRLRNNHIMVAVSVMLLALSRIFFGTRT